MVERSEQAALTVHLQIARGPDGRRTHVTGKDGIVVGIVADALRQILRMNCFFAGLRQVIKPLARVAIVFQRFIEELTVGFLLKMRHQRAEGRFNIADQRHIHFTVGANTAGIDINLNDFRVRRVEGAIGELGAE